MNIPWWIPAASAALATAILAWLLHSASIHRLETQHEVELNKQADAIRDNFKTINSVAEARANALQDEFNRTNDDLKRLRQRPPTYVYSSAARCSDDAAKPQGQSDLVAVDFGAIGERFGECDKCVAKLEACQDTLLYERELNGAAK